MKNLLIILSIFVMMMPISCRSREERNRRAMEKGQAQTEEKASMIHGIGDGLKGAGKKAAEALSEGVGEVYNGVNEGLDKSLIKKEIRVCDNSTEWINVSRSEKQLADTTGVANVSVYVIYEKDCTGKLLLKAHDSGDNEVGRAVVDVNEKADHANYVNFRFDARTPVPLTRYFTIEFKEEGKK